MAWKCSDTWWDGLDCQTPPVSSGTLRHLKCRSTERWTYARKRSLKNFRTIPPAQHRISHSHCCLSISSLLSISAPPRISSVWHGKRSATSPSHPDSCPSAYPLYSNCRRNSDQSVWYSDAHCSETDLWSSGRFHDCVLPAIQSAGGISIVVPAWEWEIWLESVCHRIPELLWISHWMLSKLWLSSLLVSFLFIFVFNDKFYEQTQIQAVFVSFMIRTWLLVFAKHHNANENKQRGHVPQLIQKTHTRK